MNDAHGPGGRRENKENRWAPPPDAPFDPPALTLSVREAAKLLGISSSHAYDLCARDELPCIHLGRRVLVWRSGLLTLLSSPDLPPLITPLPRLALSSPGNTTDLPLPKS